MEHLELLDREIAEQVIADASVKRLLTITGVNIIVLASLVAAIGDIRRFSSPQNLVSYVGLGPRVRQSGARSRLSAIDKAPSPRPPITCAVAF